MVPLKSLSSGKLVRPPMRYVDFAIPVYTSAPCAASCDDYRVSGPPVPDARNGIVVGPFQHYIPWWVWGVAGVAGIVWILWTVHTWELNKWKKRIRKFVRDYRGQKLTPQAIITGLDVAIAEISRKLWWSGEFGFSQTYQSKVDRAMRIADEVLREERAGWQIADLDPEAREALRDAVENVVDRLELREAIEKD